MTIANQPIGQQGHVVWIHDEGPVGERLLEMGLTPGAPVRVVRRSSRNGPMQLEVRGYRLTLHPSEAETVEVAA